VMEIVYAIKAGRQTEQLPRLTALARHLTGRGAGGILLGCTELSLCHDELAARGLRLVDPLRVLAGHLVCAAGRAEIEHRAVVR
jgi:aspartate/glutamate racemase